MPETFQPGEMVLFRRSDIPDAPVQVGMMVDVEKDKIIVVHLVPIDGNQVSTCYHRVAKSNVRHLQLPRDFREWKVDKNFTGVEVPSSPATVYAPTEVKGCEPMLVLPDTKAVQEDMDRLKTLTTAVELGVHVSEKDVRPITEKMAMVFDEAKLTPELCEVLKESFKTIQNARTFLTSPKPSLDAPITKLSPRPGDVLVLHVPSLESLRGPLLDMAMELHQKTNCLVAVLPLGWNMDRLSELDMNAHGWYKEPIPDVVARKEELHE